MIDTAARHRKRGTKPAVRLRGTWALDGPNAWIDRPAVRLQLDMGNTTGEALDRLNRLLSGLADAPVSPQATDGSATHESQGNAGALLADIVMELQQLAGDQVTFSTSAPTGRDGRFDVICECRETDLALAAAGVAARYLNQLVYQSDPHFDLDREFNRRVMWHIGYRDSQREQQAIIRAARRRNIPVRFFDKRQRLVEFGLGAYTERYLAIMTSKSNKIASLIARDKPLAKEFLQQQGVPVPDGAVVRTVDEAVQAVERLGYPVVVKPSDAKHGNGVTIGVQTFEELEIAVEKAVAASKSGRALVETIVPGKGFRVLVIGDRIAAIQERVPAHVIGDGERTVAELIAIVNLDPQRQPGNPSNRHQIVIDDGTLRALEFQGLTLDSVPEQDRHVPVKLVANGHQGGTSVPRPGAIHPDNAMVARLAARAVGLEVCGLDMIIPDISQSVWEVGGAVIEVNSEPGYRNIVQPAAGPVQDAGMAVIDMFYPPGRPHQPAMVAIAVSNDHESPARLIARILRASGLTVGMATRSVTEIDGPDFGLKRPAERSEIDMVARNPYVTGAIFEVGQQDIEKRGFPFLQCDVAILDSGEAQGPAPGARRLDQVLSGLISATGAIISHPSDLVLALAGASQQLILTSVDPHHPAIGPHMQQGGRVVTISDAAIVLRGPGTDLPIASLETLSGEFRDMPTIALLQAVAAGLALDVPVEVIRNALGNG